MTQVSKSLANYLRAVEKARKSHEKARIRDIADILGVKPPSVVKALRRLEEKGLVVYEKHGHIGLTSAGSKLVKAMSEKHSRVHGLLVALGMDESVADRDASRITPELSDEALNSVSLPGVPSHDLMEPGRMSASKCLSIEPDICEMSEPMRLSRDIPVRQSTLFACQLSQLKPGQKGRVVRILQASGAPGGSESSLPGKGFGRGRIVEVKDIGNADSLIRITVGKKNVCLSQSEAESIVVDLV